MEKEIQGTCPKHGDVPHTQPCAVLLRPSRCIPCVNEAQVAAFDGWQTKPAKDALPQEAQTVV